MSTWNNLYKEKSLRSTDSFLESKDLKPCFPIGSITQFSKNATSVRLEYCMITDRRDSKPVQVMGVVDAIFRIHLRDKWTGNISEF